MTEETWFRLAADGLLVLHVGFVLFVVLGLALVLAGGAVGWGWVRNRRFRVLHMVAIGIVVAQAWLGRVCPLTTWEMSFRARAGDASYDGAFIAHWLGELLYHDLPAWVFVAAYTAFAALVVLAWLRVPPRPRRRSS